MRIGIDVTWLKPKKSGGVEAYIKNLIDGFLELNDDNKYVLFLAKDNYDYIKDYFKSNDRLEFIKCNTYALKVKQHLLWQNLCEYSTMKKNNIEFAFFPVYEMPIYKNRKLKCATTIHDIQAFHYPEYFSKMENIWFNFGWKRVLNTADRVIAITDYTKQDLKENIKNTDNIVRIYNPIIMKNDEIANFEELKNKYNIKEKEYYYTVCSMHKHKNLITLVNMIKEIKDKKIEGIPDKLVISGVGGPNKENLIKTIKELQIEKNVIITEFVSDEERNSLIKNSNAFLFPSKFEGFGMPPIEAMKIGARVITTKCTSLPEVTQGKCRYVDDATNTENWIEQIKQIQNDEYKIIEFDTYEKTKIARQYLDLFYEIKGV